MTATAARPIVAAPAADGVRPTWQKAAIAAGWLAFAVPVLFDLVAVVTASRDWLVASVPDDAYYYLEIARRLSTGHGFTFDGQHATNGFHPLWQLLLVPLAAAFHGDDALVKAALVVELTCLVVAVLLVMRLIWALVGPGPALASGIVLVHSTYFMTAVDGMESGVFVLSLALLATVLCAYWRRPTTWRAVLVGVISALVVLARLDGAVVVWIVPIVLARRERAWRPALLWLAGLMVAAPWGIWYLLQYHHVLTTSATVKQAQVSDQIHAVVGGWFTPNYVRFYDGLGDSYVRALLRGPNATLVDRRNPLSQLTGVALTILALVGFVPAAWSWARARRHLRPAPRLHPAAAALALVGVLVTLKALADLVDAFPWALLWYSQPARIAVSMTIGCGAWMGASWLLARWRVVGVVSFAYLLVACIPLGIASSLTAHDAAVSSSSWQGELDQAASWIDAHGPSGRYGALDAGLLGYRLDGRSQVVNLDGLVNNYANAELVVHKASLVQRIRANSIDYFVERLDDHVLTTQLGCGTVLWSSPGASLRGDGADPGVHAPVRVVDVRGCR